MYELEKDKISHLTILICYTIFSVILVGESILLGWDMRAVILLFVGMMACWVLHITRKIPGEIRIWLYYVLTLLSFFFYGSHETSMFDLAPVIILIMLLYSTTDCIRFTNFCVLTYYVTMFYDILFVCKGNLALTQLTVTRLLLHFVLVTVAGYLVILHLKRRDVDQKLAREKITELEEINHRTEQFLTNVSHELRTPINAVTGITTVMLKNETEPHKKKDLLSIQNAGKRLFQQIEDILDYTELDTGRIKISSDNYMISSIVNDILTEERARERDTELEIIFDVDPSVPSVLLGDGRKVKKMLKHLLDNALKFTKQGGVYVRIHAMPKPYGMNLCMQVKDTGIGVGEEQLSKIREKFYQAQNGKMRRAGGLGLGLSIVYGLTAALEGFVQIESTEGHGTTVSISIPQKIAEESPCMTVTNKTDFCVACYMNPQNYDIPEVRDYFNRSISHLIQALDISLYRVTNLDELNRLVSHYRLTHLFICQAEYEEDITYFESLTEQMRVVVVAKDSYEFPHNSKVSVIGKPFCNLSVVNLLNADTKHAEESFTEAHILCPGLKVLVVDDEPMNLMVAEGIFKQYQMYVTTAESGMEALELCKKETYDLIFLDHMMPEMDGVETLKLLRRISAIPGKALTVIAFTANAVSGAREMFLQEGFDEFVSKPIEDTELERVLKKVLPRSAYVYEEEEATENHTSALSENDIKLHQLDKAGLQTRMGINYCRGDVPFYFELLSKFSQDAEKKMSLMKQFLEEDDCDNYRIQVHALKSTSKMIGAKKVSDLAKELEDAAKNGQIGFLKNNHSTMLAACQALVQTIDECLVPEKTDEEENCKYEITKSEFLQQLQNLRAGLETFEVDRAETLLEQMQAETYQNTNISELLLPIRQDVGNFDFEQCITKVDSLIEKIEGGE